MIKTQAAPEIRGPMEVPYVDSLVIGLVVGALVGFAGFTLRLAQLAALAGAAGLVWIMVERGPTGLEPLMNDIIALVKPHARLIAGALLGAVLGGALLGQLRGRTA